MSTGEVLTITGKNYSVLSSDRQIYTTVSQKNKIGVQGDINTQVHETNVVWLKDEAGMEKSIDYGALGMDFREGQKLTVFTATLTDSLGTQLSSSERLVVNHTTGQQAWHVNENLNAAQGSAFLKALVASYAGGYVISMGVILMIANPGIVFSGSLVGACFFGLPILPFVKSRYQAKSKELAAEIDSRIAELAKTMH